MGSTVSIVMTDGTIGFGGGSLNTINFEPVSPESFQSLRCK